uniref:Uncharacterized protein n=1 Tax=Kalanchoe fedtschenkoi TaxID=63787 RepID=A0A7N0V7H4_KALFE
MAPTTAITHRGAHFTTSDDEEELVDHHESIYDSADSSSSDDQAAAAAARDRRRRRPTLAWWPCSRSSLSPKWVQEWNRVFLIVCAAGLLIDPLFFYALSISEGYMCMFVDGWFALTVTVMRCMADAMHLWNLWLQIKLGNRKLKVGGGSDEEEEMRGRHQRHHFRLTKKGLLFDIFVMLPLPQVVLWVVIPYLINKGSTTLVMTVYLIVFLFQYLPKLYHCVSLLRREQCLSGYVFGTLWWGLALNLIAYFVAGHAAGACWYLLGIQRATQCLREQCRETDGCDPRITACKPPVYYGAFNMVDSGMRLAWFQNSDARSTCLLSDTTFDYGVYALAVQLLIVLNYNSYIYF